MNSALQLPAGDLRHRIDIQSFTEAADAMGQRIETWSTATTRWGMIRPLSGNERVSAMQVNEGVSHRIVIRYYSALTPSMRFKFQNRLFNIVNILDIEERHKLQVCLAIETVPA